MKIVGLTGGIGSGKTTVAAMFKELGVPVYIADVEAKKLANSSKIIRKKLIELLGEAAYDSTGLNRSFVAAYIFNDEKILQQVNQIIHPKVKAHFKRWVKQQEGVYCIKEVAILFENGGYKECDYTILITAPKKVKIKRLLQRDNTTEEAVLARMKNQWSDAKKIKLAHTVLENTDLEKTQKAVLALHKKLLKSQ
ncbi:dephospho-CoA kinase [Rasiella sp. SM2506]|uniref:dephospho-CoA kinase n=1 Tax=Rasiella sp. SM2506 TaxID=3423914 RepID=UPI003D7A6439